MSSDDNGRLFQRFPLQKEQPGTPISLPARPKMLYKGLTNEYVQAVIDGTTNHPTLALLGSGTLGFSWAAHDLVGSSYVVFRWLGWGIVQLLLQGHQGSTAAEISSLLQLETRAVWKNPVGDEPL